MLDAMTDNRLMFRTLMRAFVTEIPRSAFMLEPSPLLQLGSLEPRTL
jgi:hypothetical protein